MISGGYQSLLAAALITTALLAAGGFANEPRTPPPGNVQKVPGSALLVFYGETTAPLVGDGTARSLTPKTTILGQPPEPGARQVAADVQEYLRWLDSLGALNSREAKSEKTKGNMLSFLTIAAGVIGAVAGLFGTNDKRKARIAALGSAVAAFATGMNTAYKHPEDAEAYRTCAKRIEVVRRGFSPISAQFDIEKRKVLEELEKLDCLKPLEK